MRCIETQFPLLRSETQDKINYNMRCIETGVITKIVDAANPDKLQHEMY